MKTFLMDLQSIFINPTLVNDKFQNRYNLGTITIYLFFVFVLFLLFGIISTIIHNNLNVSVPYSNLEISFVKAVLLAPLMEEFCFRAFFKKSKINLLLFFIGLAYLICGYIYYCNWVFYYLILIVLFGSYFFIIKKIDFSEPYNGKKLTIWVYLSCLIFGFSHIINYKVEFNSILFLFIILFLKVCGAFFLMLLRLKFGLMYSILFHFFINFLGFVLYMLDK